MVTLIAAVVCALSCAVFLIVYGRIMDKRSHVAQNAWWVSAALLMLAVAGIVQQLGQPELAEQIAGIGFAATAAVIIWRLWIIAALRRADKR